MANLEAVVLDPLQSEEKSETRPLAEWVTSFQLVMVALDPFKHESAWILNTANRVLKTFAQANCRASWLVTGTDDEAKRFLGPLAKERLTFVDPDRTAVKELSLSSLPAFLHINHGPEIIGKAEGWQPAEWRDIAKNISKMLSWRAPIIPSPNDPAPFIGSPI